MAGKKQLFRSRKNKKVFGVLGGLGDYYALDPTLLRLAWIFIVVFTGFFPGIVAYILAAIIMPQQ